MTNMKFILAVLLVCTISPAFCGRFSGTAAAQADGDDSSASGENNLPGVLPHWNPSLCINVTLDNGQWTLIAKFVEECYEIHGGSSVI